MKGTIRTTLNKRTALGQTLVHGCYTREDLKQTVTIICGFSKQEAEQVLEQKNATMMELILCKGLVNAFVKGEEEGFKKRMMRRFNCGTTVEKNKNETRYGY